MKTKVRSKEEWLYESNLFGVLYVGTLELRLAFLVSLSRYPTQTRPEEQPDTAVLRTAPQIASLKPRNALARNLL